MAIEIKVPVLPESVADATMLDWHKQPGDSVKRDENLVDIETDKVVLEVPCPVDGILQSINRQSGDTVVSDEVIATLEPGDSSAAGTTATATAPAPAAPAATAATADSRAPVSQSDRPGAIAADTEQPTHGPAVRNLLAQHGLDPAEIDGSGRDGRIQKEDIARHFENKVAPDADASTSVNVAAGAAIASAAAAGTVAAGAASRQPASRSNGASAAAQPVAAAGERIDRREPMTRLRQTIARRLVESQQTAALLTTFNEVDMTEVMALRTKYKQSFEQRHGVKLGFMSFFVKASIDALRQFPAVNAYVEDKDIVYHDYQDIGIAVSSPRGLVVPIIRDAQSMSFATIESTINDFGQRAGSGDLAMDELMGGTFTISNGGVFGSMLSTPIINPPQSGILGMHRIEKRAMVIDDEVVVRPMMYLALSYDHRIVDGREAVQFLVAIKNNIEDPARLMLEV